MFEKIKHPLFLSVAHFLLVGLVAAVVEHVITQKEGEHPLRVPTIVIAILLVVILYMILSLSSRLEDVAGRIGIKTTLLEAKDAYPAAEKVIDKAEKEILIVTNWALPFAPDPGVKDQMKSYFPALLNKVKQGKVLYQRILQVPLSGSKVEQFNTSLIDHIQECIEAGKTIHKIGVFKCSPSIMTTFLLIDSIYVFLQFDEFQEDGKTLHFSKCLMVEDRTGTVAPRFKELFEYLKNHATIGLMKQEDLKELANQKAAPAS